MVLMAFQVLDKVMPLHVFASFLLSSARYDLLQHWALKYHDAQAFRGLETLITMIDDRTSHHLCFLSEVERLLCVFSRAFPFPSNRTAVA
jgi:hypothetical protein